MIVDFQHHFTPRELIKDDPGDRLVLHYDENGAPSYTVHSLLYDLDEHVRMMDEAGIDAAWLTSAAGMAADLERSKICNERAKHWDQAEKDLKQALALYPDQPHVLNYLGYSWIDHGINLDDGMKMIRRSVEQRPDDG